MTSATGARGRSSLLGAGLAILWSYNTLLSDFSGLARMELRHALAAEILLIAVGALLGLCGTLRRFTR